MNESTKLIVIEVKRHESAPLLTYLQAVHDLQMRIELELANNGVPTPIKSVKIDVRLAPLLPV